jgi:hypothetical protein
VPAGVLYDLLLLFGGDLPAGRTADVSEGHDP